jgi:integrative and conjugative element protein (TIGR02256 family)
MGKSPVSGVFVQRDRMNSVFYLASNKGLIAISEEAMAAMLIYVQTERSAPESGGVLIGRKLKESPDWIVDAISTPQDSDRRKRFRFFRSKNPHQKAIDIAWRDSGGTRGYLGEWHTHPEPHPTPSHIDREHWLKAMQTFRFEGDTLFFAILGTESLAVFQGNKKSRSITKLEPRPKPSCQNQRYRHK